MWNTSNKLTITTVILYQLNPPQRTVKVSHLLVLYMDDLKLVGKPEEELQKQCKEFGTSRMIFIWNLDLTSMQRLYARKEN